MNITNITFYNHRISPEVILSQKKVFDFFNLSLDQIHPENWEGHGQSIDGWLTENHKYHEVIIIWDIDCIPLNREIVEKAYNEAREGVLFGVSQRASHIKDSDVPIYIGPAFMAFSVDTWKALGKPTFRELEEYDCAGYVTFCAIKNSVPIHYLYPSSVETAKWKLDKETWFGLGTIYNNSIYHGFLSRKGQTENFIRKCKEVYEKN